MPHDNILFYYHEENDSRVGDKKTNYFMSYAVLNCYKEWFAKTVSVNKRIGAVAADKLHV